MDSKLTSALDKYRAEWQFDDAQHETSDAFGLPLGLRNSVWSGGCYGKALGGKDCYKSTFAKQLSNRGVVPEGAYLMDLWKRGLNAKEKKVAQAERDKWAREPLAIPSLNQCSESKDWSDRDLKTWAKTVDKRFKHPNGMKICNYRGRYSKQDPCAHGQTKDVLGVMDRKNPLFSDPVEQQRVKQIAYCASKPEKANLDDIAFWQYLLDNPDQETTQKKIRSFLSGSGNTQQVKQELKEFKEEKEGKAGEATGRVTQAERERKYPVEVEPQSKTETPFDLELLSPEYQAEQAKAFEILSALHAAKQAEKAQQPNPFRGLKPTESVIKFASEPTRSNFDFFVQIHPGLGKAIRGLIED